MDWYIKFLYTTIIGRSLLWITTSKTYSNFNALYLKSRFSQHKIKTYMQKYQIDLNDYEAKEYQSFNDFFIRRIKQEKRPINGGLIAIADANLTVYQINDDLTLPIKNTVYEVKDLINDEALAKKYAGGLCLVYRLSVEDYHHYVFLDDGVCNKPTKIKGVLHTVRPIATNKYSVYIQNSREYTILKTKNFGEVIQIEIGALLVGKINNLSKEKFIKGEEKGYFEFGGSTIVLLFKPGMIKLAKKFNHQDEIKVKVGERIGDAV